MIYNIDMKTRYRGITTQVCRGKKLFKVQLNFGLKFSFGYCKDLETAKKIFTAANIILRRKEVKEYYYLKPELEEFEKASRHIRKHIQDYKEKLEILTYKVPEEYHVQRAK